MTTARAWMMVLALAACGKDVAKPNGEAAGSAASTPTETAKSPAYRSERGRYTVGTTFGAVEEKDMTDPQGVVWPSATWNTKRSMYTTQYADFASPEAALAEMRAFKLTSNPSELTRDEAGTFQGRPGRELGMKTSTGMEVAIRFIADGARLYKAMTGTKIEQANATAFIESMKIDGEAPAAAAAVESEAMKAGRAIVALYQEATKLGVATAGDCAAFNTGIDPIRTKLWDLGKAHPGVLRELSDTELKSIGVLAAQTAVSEHLMACKDSVHAKEFAFAIGKVMDATPAERAAAKAPAAAEPVAQPAQPTQPTKKKAAKPAAPKQAVVDDSL